MVSSANCISVAMCSGSDIVKMMCFLHTWRPRPRLALLCLLAATASCRHELPNDGGPARDSLRDKLGAGDGPRAADRPRSEVLKRDLSKPDAIGPDARRYDLYLGDCTSVDAFSITPFSHQPPGKMVISENITVGAQPSGCKALVTVSGTGAPEFDIGGTNSWGTGFIWIKQGQSLRLRVTTAATGGATVTPLLTIGSQSATWVVATCSAGKDCMTGALGGQAGTCPVADGGTPVRVHEWSCPGVLELFHAYEFTYELGGTGLVACPAKANCFRQPCGGNEWQVGTLACP